MKTLEEIKLEVAKENGLGKLVTGHSMALFDEAARRYANEVIEYISQHLDLKIKQSNK